MMQPDTLTVFYDGGCPLCRREIATYRALKPQGVRWINVADARPAAGGGTGSACPLDRAALLARFHVQRPDGRMVSGARAFILLWHRVPRFRWLGRVAGTPPLPALLEGGYRLFLRLRPWIVRRAVRDKRAAPPG
ncbi:hypothetical protein C882_0497 [Caenispirillum salinarum AK4]|uniref:Cell division inhibitor n=1 Tax=Caenispirillum salinarum AK4 TaxID=1238182 RepID=K9GT97_9PROT|nr:DUF393 domain-containing protein [Caenispirillum salinarum]EKV29190.1 hypothetical protein C882_0497 [Caenispirillum salinarum AK4]